MIHRVLVIGGYGNFGAFISKTLAKESNIQVIVAGRSLHKAEALIRDMDAVNSPEALLIDINHDISGILEKTKPNIVIHTSGPFQTQDYGVAIACLNQSIHYMDLADGRDFVANIGHLNDAAIKNDALVISGASSVPCLTAALVDAYQHEFEILEHLDYGITTAQRTARGLATTAAILGYVGRPFKTLINQKQIDVYGWQGIRTRKYSKLGRRLLGYCDVPDLSLFPQRYPELKTIRFYAGLEIPFVHFTLWCLSWLVRIGIIKGLEKFAPLLLRISFLFDWAGSDKSGFHMGLSGKDNQGLDKKISFELIATSGDGPYIPCIPAILITKKLIAGSIRVRGAFPCLDFVTLQEYLEALKGFNITWEIKNNSLSHQV